MDMGDFIAEDSVIAGLKVSSKKQLLQELSDRAAHMLDVPQRDVFDTLLQREKLGSTGLGGGIALPHGKLPQVEALFGMVATLSTPVAFDAVDDQPVDVVFLLLAPESAGADHLKALARIARFVKTSGTVEKMRGCRTASALYATLIESEGMAAA